MRPDPFFALFSVPGRLDGESRSVHRVKVKRAKWVWLMTLAPVRTSLKPPPT
jgi:hypothetical protein